MSITDEFVKTVNSGCGFFGHTNDLFAHFGEPTGAGRHALFDLGKDRFFFFGFGDGNQIVFAVFHPRTHQDVQCRVAAIVQNQVRPFWKHEGTVKIIPMLHKGLTLDGKNWHARFGDGRRSVILRREDVA